MSTIEILSPKTGDTVVAGKGGSVKCKITHAWQDVLQIPGSVRFSATLADGTTPLTGVIPVKDDHAIWKDFIWPDPCTLTITAVLDGMAVGSNLDSDDATITVVKAGP